MEKYNSCSKRYESQLGSLFHYIILLYHICLYTIYVYIFIYIYIHWLVVSTPLKNMKVSWDHSSQYMEKSKHVPNHQPERSSKVSNVPWISHFWSPSQIKIAIPGSDSLEVPTIYKAYFWGLSFREYPRKILPYMVLTYLQFRILEISLWTKGIDNSRPLGQRGNASGWWQCWNGHGNTSMPWAMGTIWTWKWS